MEYVEGDILTQNDFQKGYLGITKDGIIELKGNFEIDQLSEELYYSKMDAVRDNYERCMNITSAEDLLFEEVIKYGF